MGNSEEAKSTKPEKPPSPAPEQPNIHVYPDWAAMQPMMPPYGAPYAVYAHGGVYAHPGVPLAAPPLSIDSPAKSSGNTDRGLMKKLKGFDGLAMSLGNNSTESGEDEADHEVSHSGETEGSSDGSDGNTTGVRIIICLCVNYSKECKNETRSGSLPVGETDVALEKVMGVNVPPTSVAGKVEGTVPSPSMSGGLQTGSPPSVDAKTSMAGVLHPCAVIPNEAWLQNERELKRERRKQSNRESARRSRLRKQAEAEELAIKVESLTAENMTLKSEINCLAENSRKLKLENATLMKKLKSGQPAQAEAANLSKVDEIHALPLSTANLLSRVNNSVSSERSDREGEMYERSAKSNAKLRQLLDTSPRTDAVAAG
ncbi:hypothetical protein RJ640_003925 [Escallonia rubra]|uniref:BZIP domain-containing protein n=1 Tax=Escallonia rubra TaxID=112253 RepID=A0AA88REM7_9ASTE|nr:hypothetical protein RJ640_003925 [Escallonia rubra]